MGYAHYRENWVGGDSVNDMTLALQVMALVAMFSGIALAVFLYLADSSATFGDVSLLHPKE